jgi:hypothetical protein
VSRTGFNIGQNQTRTIMLFRLAPSVSNTIAGDLGDREVINRSELLLQKLEVTTDERCEIYGVLNPTNIADDIFTFQNSSQVAIGSTRTTQPSFSQYNFQFSGAPQNGELLFRLTTPGGGQKAEIDLSTIKSMNNSVIGGRNTFPDGPDVLAIVGTNLATGSASSTDILLQWTEAQA